MSDGAAFGIGAERALGTILGGEPAPTEEEGMSVAEMTEWLVNAPAATDPAALTSYGECARAVAGEILRWALANPQRYARTPAENEYEHDAEGKLVFNDEGGLNLVQVGLYGVLKDEGVALDLLGITGFQWGWAYNAARRCLELPPEPNPAIVTLG